MGSLIFLARQRAHDSLEPLFEIQLLMVAEHYATGLLARSDILPLAARVDGTPNGGGRVLHYVPDYLHNGTQSNIAERVDVEIFNADLTHVFQDLRIRGIF